MHILLLDKHPDAGRQEEYQNFLEHRGHSTIALRSLMRHRPYADNKETYLSQFDMAIAHPDWIDAEALKRELENRQSFKMLVTKTDGPSEMDGRVIYQANTSLEELATLVEKGFPPV